MMLYDVIYLQTGKNIESLEEEGITWCQDRIEDGDTKYLLATPEREAAPELLEACQELVQAMVDYQMDVEDLPPFRHRKMMRKAKAAIALAAPLDEEKG